MRLLGKALSLLEALAGFPASNAALLPPSRPSAEPIIESEASPPAGATDATDAAIQSLRPAHPMCVEVAAAFARAPALGNGLPTLAALLESDHDPDQRQRHARVLPAAWLVLRTLNHLARLDLRGFQALLGGDALQSYFSYTHAVLLRRLVAELPQQHQQPQVITGGGTEPEECLEQLLVLLGYAFLLPPPAGEGKDKDTDGPSAASALRLQQQMSPLLLTRLAALPFRYWASEVHKDVLFPTLLALCFGHPERRALLANEVSLELVIAYLEERQIQRALATTDGPAPYPPKSKPKPRPGSSSGSGSGISSSTKPEPLPAWKLLALRFPPACWPDAVRFFRE